MLVSPDGQQVLASTKQLTSASLKDEVKLAMRKALTKLGHEVPPYL